MKLNIDDESMNIIAFRTHKLLTGIYENIAAVDPKAAWDLGAGALMLYAFCNFEDGITIEASTDELIQGGLDLLRTRMSIIFNQDFDGYGSLWEKEEDE